MEAPLDNQDNKMGKCMLHNWVEERAVADLDTEETNVEYQRHGHRCILSMDDHRKMETLTTAKASYRPPKPPGVRLRGIRGELLEKHIAQLISEKVYAELNPPIPKTDFCSTAQKDFCAEGFVPRTPEITHAHNYKTDPAITFWSENYQRVQGVTAIPTLKAPFRKSARFSKPISEQLDEPELPPDN